MISGKRVRNNNCNNHLMIELNKFLYTIILAKMEVIPAAIDIFFTFLNIFVYEIEN